MCLTRKKTRIQPRPANNDSTSATTHSAPENTQTGTNNNLLVTRSNQTDREKQVKKTTSSKQISTTPANVPTVFVITSSSEKDTKRKESMASQAPGQPPAQQGVNFNSTDGSSDGDKLIEKDKQIGGGRMNVPSVSPVPPSADAVKSKRPKTETTENTGGTTEEIIPPTKTDDVTKVDFASKDEKPPPKVVLKANLAIPKTSTMTKEKMKASLGASAKPKKIEYKRFESIDTLENSKETKASEVLPVEKTQQDSPLPSDKKKVKRQYNHPPSTVLATMTKERSHVHQAESKKKINPKSMDTRKTNKTNNTTLLKTDSMARKPNNALNDNVEELSRIPVVRMMTMKAEKFPIRDDHQDTLEGPTSNFSSSIKPEESETHTTIPTPTPDPKSSNPMPKSSPTPNKKAIELEKTQKSMTKTNDSVARVRRRS